MVPLLVVTGESGSGKTTLIAGIVKALSSRGYKVGVIKHSPHHPGMEDRGKDSGNFSRAGAAITCLTGRNWHYLVTAGDAPGPEGHLHFFSGLDLVLAEGYKTGRREDTPVIEIIKEGQERRYSTHPLALVFYRLPQGPRAAATPWFTRDDTAEISAFIEEKILLKEEGQDD